MEYILLLTMTAIETCLENLKVGWMLFLITDVNLKYFVLITRFVFKVCISKTNILYLKSNFEHLFFTYAFLKHIR